MFGVTAPKRTVVLIGEVPDRKVAAGAKVGEVITLPCKVEQVGEVLGALRARLRGFRIAAKTAGGIPIAKIDALMEHCRKAQYGVVVWAPPTLDVPHAELTVDQVAGLVKDLNVTQRFAGLSLGGNEGAMSAGAVSTWQSGFPLRISYASGSPRFDPYRNAIFRMVIEGEGDLLMWIASISPDLAPLRPTSPPSCSARLGSGCRKSRRCSFPSARQASTRRGGSSVATAWCRCP